jgi:hypothetical protein
METGAVTLGRCALCGASLASIAQRKTRRFCSHACAVVHWKTRTGVRKRTGPICPLKSEQGGRRVHDGARPIVPRSVLDERDARLMAEAERDPVAALNGDPAAGRSALDQRQALSTTAPSVRIRSASGPPPGSKSFPRPRPMPTASGAGDRSGGAHRPTRCCRRPPPG